MSLLDRDEVPEPKSLASTRPVDSPRVAASSATPAPTIPPPTTSTSCSVAASLASAAARSAGPSLTVVPPPAITVRTLPARAMPGAGRPGSRLPPARPARSAALRARRHDHLDPLEFLEVGVPGGGHGPAQRAHQVHRAVGDRGRAVQDLLDGADRADLQPGTARQFRVMRLAAPVVA